MAIWLANSYYTYHMIKNNDLQQLVKMAVSVRACAILYFFRFYKCLLSTFCFFFYTNPRYNTIMMQYTWVIWHHYIYCVLDE